MAIATECQTSGAVFHTEISERKVACTVDLPFDLVLTEQEATVLDANLHNAVELVLVSYFQKLQGHYIQGVSEALGRGK